MMGAEAAEKMVRPGVLKVHLPFNKTPYSEEAKYIYIARNPYDVCVSFYYHTKGFTPKTEAKKDTSLWALKIANFLGNEYGDQLRQDPALLQKVLSACSIENMRAVFNDSVRNMIQDLLNLPPEKALKSVEAYRKLNLSLDVHESEGFVRKGIVGDWRSHFTPALIAKTKEWINKKTRGTDVMQLWREVDLP
ncbi:hypothetical protein HPB50_015809 [Hyalomma asiaticum]|uniref:Uncharacterized protein n=1 Tax=Hyalomma asiaticum TaxID=266040 RepID=A0ACB7RZ82_HYAAI|nr:hypothetical protein HPB50_015809 [Hyalomma asiaticum]